MSNYFEPHEIQLFLGGPTPYFKCKKCNTVSKWYGPCTKEELLKAFSKLQEDHLKKAIDKEFSF